MISTSEDKFLGETVSFWIELRKRMQEGSDGLERAALLNEVIDLRGKVGFYEERIRQMNDIMWRRV